jgi:hypothetical protein
MDGAARLGEAIAGLRLIPGDRLEAAAAVTEDQPQERLAVTALPQVPLTDPEYALDLLAGLELAQRRAQRGSGAVVLGSRLD